MKYRNKSGIPIFLFFFYKHLCFYQFIFYNYLLFNNILKSDEEKRDFLGEKLFNLIKENKIIKEKKEDDETVSKVTGMILDIPDMKEIIGILESPSQLEERIKEGLELLEKK